MTCRVTLDVRPSLWTWRNQTGKHPVSLFCICLTQRFDNLWIFILSVCILHLFVPARYSHGPTPLQSQHYSTSQDIINSISIIQHEMRNYKPRLTQVHHWHAWLKVLDSSLFYYIVYSDLFQVMSSSVASSAISALSPGGVLMQGGGQQTINRECLTSGCLFIPS